MGKVQIILLVQVEQILFVLISMFDKLLPYFDILCACGGVGMCVGVCVGGGGGVCVSIPNSIHLQSCTTVQRYLHSSTVCLLVLISVLYYTHNAKVDEETNWNPQENGEDQATANDVFSHELNCQH